MHKQRPRMWNSQAFLFAMINRQMVQHRESEIKSLTDSGGSTSPLIILRLLAVLSVDYSEIVKLRSAALLCSPIEDYSIF